MGLFTVYIYKGCKYPRKASIIDVSALFGGVHLDLLDLQGPLQGERRRRLGHGVAYPGEDEEDHVDSQDDGQPVRPLGQLRGDPAVQRGDVWAERPDEVSYHDDDAYSDDQASEALIVHFQYLASTTRVEGIRRFSFS